YFFKGSYGNFLIGCPQINPEVMNLAKSFGGVFRVIPWTEEFQQREKRIFDIFGAYFIVSQERTGSGSNSPVPTVPAKQSPIVGVKFLSFDTKQSENVFTIEWEGQIFTNAESAATEVDMQLNKHQGVLSKKQTNSFSAFTLHKQMKEINPSLVLASHDTLDTIIVFDDIEFEKNDYEVISPKQRMQLRSVLKILGFQQITGNCFEHEKEGTKINLTKPQGSRAGAMLKHIEAYGLNIVTATQGAYLIANSGKLTREEKSRDLLNLLSNIPVNLKKLKSIEIPADWQEESWMALLAEMAKTQKKTIEHYSRNEINGMNGHSAVRGVFDLVHSHRNDLSQI
ncbi:MAG: hypothetical protein AAF518_19005, partial [Spirochaetota bacterium]